MIQITGITGCLVLGLFVVIILTQLFRDNNASGVESPVSDNRQELPLTEAQVLLLDKGEGKQLTFFDLNANKEYTLKFSGSTYFYDKHEQAISLDQIEQGEIADIRFHKKSEQLHSLQQSDLAWSLTELENFSLNPQKKELTIGQVKYRVSENVRCFLNGEPIELSEVSAGDSIAVRGIDQEVLSIRVDNGYGRLTLENEEAFEGGWIEVGQNIIRRVEKDTSILVPEGTHKVVISYRGYMDTETVEIIRGEETLLDVGDLAESIIKYGKVYFHVTPEDAQVYIDGTLVDTSRLIRMPYGLHQLMAKADGYDTLTQYFRLEGESASLDVVLQVPEEPEESSKESSSSAESTASSTEASKESSTPAEFTASSTEASKESSTPAESAAPSTEASKESSTPAESAAPSTEASKESSTPAESAAPSTEASAESSAPAESAAPSTEASEESSTPTESAAPSTEASEESSTPAESAAPSTEASEESSTPAESTAPGTEASEESRTEPSVTESEGFQESTLNSEISEPAESKESSASEESA